MAYDACEMRATSLSSIAFGLCFVMQTSRIVSGESVAVRFDFEAQDTKAWKPVAVLEDGEKPSLEILQEGTNRYLRLSCKEKTEFVYLRDIEPIDIKPGTILRWKWRMAQAVPHRPQPFTQWGNFPCKVYLYLDHDPLAESGPALSYMWSLVLAMTQWDRSPNPTPHRYLSVEHGTHRKGEWITEERDLYRDAVAAFDKVLPQTPRTVKAVGLSISVLGERGFSTFDIDDIEIATE